MGVGTVREFGATVVAALKHLETRDVGLDLDILDTIPRLYGASAGRIGMLARILQIAGHEAAGAVLDLAGLARAAGRIQAQPVPMAQFFREDPPEDVQLIRAHASILVEAGLEPRPTTLGGLRA